MRPRPLSSRNMPASANDNRGTVLEEVGADEACLSDLDTVHYPRTCLHPSTLFENRSAGVIGDHCAPSRSSAIGPDSVTSPPSGPPMGDASHMEHGDLCVNCDPSKRLKLAQAKGVALKQREAAGWVPTPEVLRRVEARNKMFK